MDKRPEQTLLQRGHRDGQRTYEKMLNVVTSHQRNAIKTTVRYHLTPARMATINKSTNKCLARLWRKGSPCALAVGMQTGAPTMESSMEGPQKVEDGSAF